MVKKIKNIYYKLVDYIAFKRVIFFSKNLKLGKRVNIGRRCKFIGNVNIGDNSTIVSHALFHGGDITVGSNVIIASGCTILTRNHDISICSDALPYGTSYKDKPVTIERNVWIGRNVSLAPGAHIGEGSVIGMNSVVFGAIPKNSIALGNPARVVKNRDLDHYNYLKDNHYFLNDIRGLNHLSNRLMQKKTKELLRLSKRQDLVYDYELSDNPRDVRKILYYFSLDNMWGFGCDENGFFIKKS